MVGSGLCTAGAEWKVAEPRREESAKEAGEGAEEVREGATEGGAQDAEDGAEEYEVSANPILNACCGSPQGLKPANHRASYS